MAYKKKYEVRLTKQDLRNIHNERTFDVNNSHKDLGTIIRNRLYSMGVHQNDLSVEISDNALYYKVKVYAKDSLKLLFEMLTVTVEGLPLTVLEVLDSDHTVKVNI